MKKQKVPSLKEIEKDWDRLEKPNDEALRAAALLREQTQASRAKKDESITIRISGADKRRIIALAERAGIPYQTLVGSVLHKFSTEQFVELNEARKLLGVSLAGKARKRA